MMNENKTHTQQRRLYLGSLSFRESKTLKDKVTALTSALCARMGGWTRSCSFSFLLEDGYGSQIKRTQTHTHAQEEQAAQGFKAAAAKGGIPVHLIDMDTLPPTCQR